MVAYFSFLKTPLTPETEEVEETPLEGFPHQHDTTDYVTCISGHAAYLTVRGRHGRIRLDTEAQ